MQQFRRAVLLAAALGALLILALTGISFTATNGTATTTIGAGGVGTTGDFAVVHTSAGSLSTILFGKEANSTTKIAAPGWNPVVNQVVPIATAGDLAIIDARGTTGAILVTVALTNPVQLSAAYSYFNMPIDVYQGTFDGTNAVTWQSTSLATGANGVAIGDSQKITYLSLTNGYVTFLLQGGTNRVYELHVPNVDGSSNPTGSFYLVNAGGTLSPTINVTVTAAG